MAATFLGLARWTFRDLLPLSLRNRAVAGVQCKNY